MMGLHYAGLGKTTWTLIMTVVNRPFPSSKKSHFQSEAKCEAIDMKMIFNYDANKTHFHNKGFALSLVLKVRFFGTRKWPIKEHYVIVKSTMWSLKLKVGDSSCPHCSLDPS